MEILEHNGREYHYSMNCGDPELEYIIDEGIKITNTYGYWVEFMELYTWTMEEAILDIKFPCR